MTIKQERAERRARETQRSMDRNDAREKAHKTAYYSALKAHGFEPEKTDWDDIPVWLSFSIEEADATAQEAAQSAVKAAQEAAEETAFKAELEIYAGEYAEQYKRTLDAEITVQAGDHGDLPK